MHNPTDELLVAYMDGELNLDAAALLEAELRQNPKAQARLDAFCKVSDLVQAAAQGAPAVQEPGVAASLAGLAARSQRLARIGFASACAASLLYAGSSLRSPATDLSRQTILYEAVQRLPSGDAMLALSALSGRLEEDGAVWLSQQLGAPLRLPRLPGWNFSAGQLLRTGYALTVELIYTAPGRSPIAICIGLSGQVDQPPKEKIIDGLRISEWSQRGYFLAVLGDLTKGEMERISGHIRKDWPDQHGPAGTPASTGQGSVRIGPQRYATAPPPTPLSRAGLSA